MSSEELGAWYINKVRTLHREYAMMPPYIVRHLSTCYGLELDTELVEKILTHSAKEDSSSKSKDWKRLRSIWNGMMRRCSEKTHPRYKDYGGKGISVCSQWAEFWNFYLWSKQSGYSSGLTLDRLVNRSGYEPNNCRWVVAHVQSSNRRNVCTPGVHKLPDGTYKSSLTIDKKVVYLEHFPTEKEAIAARREAERTYLGYSISK